jgi:N-acetylglucosaminyl-diphospho-decaprenol L-rhamnosyltransferase
MNLPSGNGRIAEMADQRQPAEPCVGIVTVSHNSTAALPAFLSSAKRAGVPAPPVFIADNDSNDIAQLRDLARNHDAHLIEVGLNVGYGAGITQAIQAAPKDLEFFVISNPDVIFAEGAIDELIAAARRNPRAGAVGPRIIDETGAVYPSARALPSLRTGIGHALFSRVWPSNPWTRRYRNEDAPDGERVAGWLSGACLLVRRTAFEEIHGFDEGYFMYFEDVDLGRRMGDAGWVNLYAPSATVTHTGAHSTSQTAGTMARAHHDSAYRYLAHRYRAWYLAPVRVVLRVGLAARLWWVMRPSRR